MIIEEKDIKVGSELFYICKSKIRESQSYEIIKTKVKEIKINENYITDKEYIIDKRYIIDFTNGEIEIHKIGQYGKNVLFSPVYYSNCQLKQANNAYDDLINGFFYSTYQDALTAVMREIQIQIQHLSDELHYHTIPCNVYDVNKYIEEIDKIKK